MSSIKLLPARFNIELLRGDDFSIDLVVVDESGSPIDLSAATVDTAFIGATDTLHNSVGGSNNNIITLSLSDVETAALSRSTLHWTLTVTLGGDKRQWISGRFAAKDPGDNTVNPSSTSYRVVVGTGDSVRVTVGANAEALANSDAFTSKFRPLGEEIYLDAGVLQVVTGAGTRADLNDLTPYWSVGDAVIGVGASFRVPAGWSTLSVDVEWFNTTTTAGNALFRADRSMWGDGDAIDRTLGGYVQCAAPTVANQATVDRLLTGVACTAGKRFSIGANRIGTDPNDTLTGVTIGILGISITKAS